MTRVARRQHFATQNMGRNEHRGSLRSHNPRPRVAILRVKLCFVRLNFIILKINQDKHNKLKAKLEFTRIHLERNCRERCGAIDAEEIREMGKQGQVCVEEYSN